MPPKKELTHDYLESFEAEKYPELLAMLKGIARDITSDPSTFKITSQDVADKIEQAIKFPAINNRSTWPPGTNKTAMTMTAEEMDMRENELQRAAPNYNTRELWHVDCGLMASLAERYKMGNCDDLASLALDHALKNYPGFLFCYTQSDAYNHSFLLIYKRGDTNPWLADVWVHQDRSISFETSVWASRQDSLKLRVMPVISKTRGVGVIEEWKKHQDSPAEYPRRTQVGNYSHESACEPSANGLVAR